MEVTPEAPAVCRTRRKEIVQNRIREALREAVHSALTAEEVRKLVEEELVLRQRQAAITPFLHIFLWSIDR